MDGRVRIIPILLSLCHSPIKDYGYKDKEKVLYNGFWRRFKLEKNFPEITGRKIVAYFNFDTANNSELVVKVALSAVSTEGAIKNLHAEASGKSFEQLAEAAAQIGIVN